MMCILKCFAAIIYYQCSDIFVTTENAVVVVEYMPNYNCVRLTSV